MTKPARDANLRWPGFLLAALVLALVMFLGAGTASASAASAAQTRVGPHTLAAQVLVGPHGDIDAGQRLGNDPPAYDSGLATGVAAKPAVGFAAGLGETALTTGRLQHGTKNLVSAGVLPAWSGKNSPGVIKRALTPILEHPSATFDHTLGGTSVRGFLGEIDGRQVAAFVYKEGPYQGQLASSSVPSANQLKMWGVAP